MKRLLAVAVAGPWEGDWQQSQGNELAAIAAPVGEGEQVTLEVETGVAVVGLFLSSEPSLVPRNCLRYRVVKTSVREDAVHTTVEMILRGPTSS